MKKVVATLKNGVELISWGDEVIMVSKTGTLLNHCGSTPFYISGDVVIVPTKKVKVTNNDEIFSFGEPTECRLYNSKNPNRYKTVVLDAFACGGEESMGWLGEKVVILDD